MESSRDNRSCGKGLNGLPSLNSFHDINPLSFTPIAEDNTLFKMTIMRRMKSTGPSIFKKARRILMRKSGLTQTEMLLIYLKLTRNESISRRLWSKTLCNIVLGRRNKMLSLNFISSIPCSLQKWAHKTFSSGKIREN